MPVWSIATWETSGNSDLIYLLLYMEQVRSPIQEKWFLSISEPINNHSCKMCLVWSISWKFIRRMSKDKSATPSILVHIHMQHWIFNLKTFVDLSCSDSTVGLWCSGNLVAPVDYLRCSENKTSQEDCAFWISYKRSVKIWNYLDQNSKPLDSLIIYIFRMRT